MILRDMMKQEFDHFLPVGFLDDDHVLAANVEVLVSGARHLLNLVQYQSVRILTAREFYQENIHKVT